LKECLSFTVDDSAKFIKEAEARRVKFDSDILNTRDNNLNVWLFDPEGNKLEIVETKPDSPHNKFESSRA